MLTIKARSIQNGDVSCSFDKLADLCPFCHKHITPHIKSAHLVSRKLTIIMQCPNQECHEVFLSYYQNLDPKTNSYFIESVSIGNVKLVSYPEEIEKLSPLFVNISNQSIKAESINLDQICGIGYRKALEFLVKDYLIYLHPEDSDAIKAMPLAQCIKEKVDNEKVQTMAKLAVWLGNDQTHYVQKWDSKDVHDLKELIEIVYYWITLELKSKQYLDDMKV